MTSAEFNSLTILQPKETRLFTVRFRRHISSVNADMQPTLMKEYLLKATGGLNTQPVFVITLENGCPLIVYKNEFEVLGLAAEEEPLPAVQEVAPAV